IFTISLHDALPIYRFLFRKTKYDSFMPAIQRPVSWTVWTSWTRNRSSPSADWSAWRPSLGASKAALHNCLPITERCAVPHTHQHVMIAALPETITVGPDISRPLRVHECRLYPIR